MTIETVLFDLDDTLTDAAQFGASVLARAVEEHGRSLAIEVIKRYPGAPYIPLLEREVGVTSAEAAAIYATYVARYREMMASGLEEHPGASDLLRALHASGVSVGLVTNKLEALAREILDLYGWGPIFGVIAGQDTCEFRKPHPGIVHYALDVLGGNVEATAFVGDTPSDMQCAKAAGVPVIVGLLHTTEPEPLLQAGATNLVPRLTDVLDALER
jgi:phosphoglycolate phosphatase